MYDWKEKNVFITGATGFVGSWLTEKMVSNGCNVTVLVKKDCPMFPSIKHLLNKIDVVYGDIRNEKIINSAVKGNEIIFDLAAVTLVPYAIRFPKETIDVNINGTLNILEAMRKNDENQILIYTSTDKVYGEPEYLPLDEKHQLIGKSPYDASKIAAERIAYTYHMTYGIPVAITRCSNIYGGRDANSLNAITGFVANLLENKHPIIRGDGKHKRDFMYIDDAIRALLLVAEKIKISNGQAFNFGTSRPIDIKNLANLVLKTFDHKEIVQSQILNESTKGEIDVQYISYKKAENLLGWRPAIPLEDGLKMTIGWFKNNKWWLEVIKKTLEYYGIHSE